jgi:uncharacterized protein YdeI (YjbR/CyaY-like superfamily)
METTNPKVNGFINRATKWQSEFKILREYCLSCGVTEELKWGKPAYSFDNKNIVIIQGFKNYCALLFPKGVLLKDPNKLLIAMTENVQSARQLRFTDVQQVMEIEHIIKAYIHEEIEIELAGLKVDTKKTSDFEVVEEFQQKLADSPELSEAYEALTPGRQRAYLFYFSQAKQSKTREARVEKCIPQILAGKGLND